MIEVYNISQSDDWDSKVKSFGVHDVFYLCGYPKAFQIHGDGDPFMLYYESDSLRAIYVYMRRPTAIDGVFDSITPYGYGGVLFEGDTSVENVGAFWTEYERKMCEEHIVDGFVRYHPVLRNAIPMKSVSCVIDLGRTIALDLSSPEVIWENIVSKNRNMIRKAEKNQVEIRHGKDTALLDNFRRIYNSTMQRDNAESYYFFGESFYESLNRDLPDNYEVFYALYEGQIIAMSIILFANKQMHYHLSGSVYEYRNLAPSNLLLYKAALWGCEQGFKTFHLGGGVGSSEDNLYKFKAAFNKNSNYRFSIGKQVFDQDLYDKLVEIRRRNDSGFDDTSAFFPLYRA
jgi:hypothetical protein